MPRSGNGGTAASGLTLNIRLPSGELESISAQSHDDGFRVVSLLLPLKELHGLPAELEIIRPDGKPLCLQEPLHAQNLRNGSTLLLRDLKDAKRRSSEEEKIVLGAEDLKVGDDLEECDPQHYPYEERDAQARCLKERANDSLKAGHFAEASELYSLALTWLPPSDSDPELAAALFGNRALAHVKLKDWAAARSDAERSLALRPENAKVRYRLGVAEQELGELESARLQFQSVLEQEPCDKAARAALSAVEARLQAKARQKAKAAAEPSVAEVPAVVRWRMERLRTGHALPRFASVWQQVGSAVDDGCAAALRHVLREQSPLQRFYADSLAAIPGASAVLLGAGSLAAARAAVALLEQGQLRSATVVEPCALLAEQCGKLSNELRVLRSQGQIDNEFAVPAAAFPPELAVVLVCDRLADDLVGERLLNSLAAGLGAARRHLPKGTKAACVPSRAALCCAPLELRSTEVAGMDVSRVNALRFSAHDVGEERAGIRGWKCRECSWQNRPETKYECELCKSAKTGPGIVSSGPPQRESLGWWPMDLDVEAGADGICCCACAAEQELWAYDFADADTFELQRRRLARTLEVVATRSGRVNAMAVWWRLEGPGGAELSSQPRWQLQDGHWPGKRQAIYYFGFEVAVEEGEVLKFGAELKDGLSRVKFELLAPKLTERMGLVKFETKLSSALAVQELREKLDLRTNRLTAPVASAGLARRDKLIKFGPFELAPGNFDASVWDKVDARLRLHVDRPLKGDAPVTCVFSRGAYEGTLRWPTPTLGVGANVPRLPSYFTALRQCEPYAAALAAAVQPSTRVVELNCGPVPVLAMCAARLGARAWAAEPLPELRDLAQEAVRDNNLAMVSHNLLGEAKEAAGVCVLRAGAKPPHVDIVTCRPDEGPLGEDYLEAMWCAAEELLEPGGVVLPSALDVWAAAVQCEGPLHEQLYAGRSFPGMRVDCGEAVVAMRVDLAQRTAKLPSAQCWLRVDRAGLLTGVACWHTPCFCAELEGPHVMVHFLPRPREVVAGEAVHVWAGFVDRQLRAGLVEAT